MWTGARDLPVAPSETFRQWWRRTHPDGETPLNQTADSRADHGYADGFPADPPPPPGEPVPGSASADGEPTPAALDARSAIANPEPIASETSETPTGSTSKEEL